MRALSLLAVVAVTLVGGGCTRLGFGVGVGVGGDAAATRPDGDAGSSELGAPTSRVVGSLHDSCASPAVIDLSPLAGGGRIEVPIDVTGAKKDYGGCLDFTFPAGHVDVALELRDVPALLEFTCTGGARIGIASGAATSCPPTLGQCYAGNCSPGNSLEQSMPPHAFVLIALPPDATNTTLVLSAR